MKRSTSRFGKTFLLLSAGVLAEHPGVRAQDFHVRHYTIDDGLPSSQIQDITQDSLGRMWFATRSGVASYDGSEWSIYNLTHGLTWADTFALRWDADGVLWSVGSAHPFKIFSFDGDAWHGIPEPDGLPADSAITSFAVLGEGSRKQVALGTNRGLFLHDDSGWRRFSREGGMPSNEVSALATAGDRLVVATSGGLAELRNGEVSALDATGRDSTVPDASRDVVGLAGETLDSGGTRLWTLGRDWIGHLEGGRLSVLAGGLQWPPVSPGTRRLAVADRRGGLFLGHGGALFHFRPESGLMPIGRDNGLLSEGASALYLDREDILWVGSRRGLSKIPNRKLVTYNLRHGLFEDEVTAVLERRHGGMALAHPSGLTLFEGGEVRTLDLLRGRPSRHDRPDRIRDLAEDDAGNLWVPAMGVARVEPSGGVRWFRKEAGLAGWVSSVVFAEGGLWAGTESGLFVRRGSRFVEASADAPRISIRRIFAGSRGGLYLAAASGLYRFSKDGWRRWSCQAAAPCNSVFAFHEGCGETLWAGTSAGLYRAVGEALVKETTPAVGRPIYFIVHDAERRAWFGTDNGVLRWDGVELAHFTVVDGLAGRETNRAAGLVDSRNRVWIGTERGVTVYSEDPEAPRRAPPTVVLTDLEAAGHRYPLEEPVRLDHDENDVVFHFRAISLVDEKRVRVSWRLEGFDEAYSPPQTSHSQEVRYTNLPPGDYLLRVKAENAEGVWGAAAVSAPLTIERPYWQRWWFFATAGLLVVAALYFVQTLIAQKRYSRRLEREVDARVEQLRKVEAELAKSQKLEAVGLLAGGIAHDFNNFLTVLMGNLSLLALPGRSEKQRADDLKDAQGAILRASKLTHQLLTFSRGGAPVRKAASVAEVILESASFILSGSKVRHEVDLPDDLRAAEIDADQIHQLLNNLLINAMQAMPEGGKVRIVGRNVDGTPLGIPRSPPGGGPQPPGCYIAVSVSDEGIGISQPDMARIFDPYFTTKEEGRGMGLASAYSIARRHDGLLAVESELGKGSTFTLYLPASEAPLPEAATAEDEPVAGTGKVLVMDDEESVRRVIGAIVEDLGYEPAYAEDGEAAVNLYRQSLVEGRSFDAVIMDLTIPGGMGGQEAIRLLLELDPSVRAVVTSGYSNDPVIASYRDYGFQGRLTKPFRTTDLAQVLREVIQGGDRVTAPT